MDAFSLLGFGFRLNAAEEILSDGVWKWEAMDEESFLAEVSRGSTRLLSVITDPKTSIQLLHRALQPPTLEEDGRMEKTAYLSLQVLTMDRVEGIRLGLMADDQFAEELFRILKDSTPGNLDMHASNVFSQILMHLCFSPNLIMPYLERNPSYVKLLGCHAAHTSVVVDPFMISICTSDELSYGLVEWLVQGHFLDVVLDELPSAGAADYASMLARLVARRSNVRHMADLLNSHVTPVCFHKLLSSVTEPSSDAIKVTLDYALDALRSMATWRMHYRYVPVRVQENAPLKNVKKESHDNASSADEGDSPAIDGQQQVEGSQPSTSTADASLEDDFDSFFENRTKQLSSEAESASIETAEAVENGKNADATVTSDQEDNEDEDETTMVDFFSLVQLELLLKLWNIYISNSSLIIVYETVRLFNSMTQCGDSQLSQFLISKCLWPYLTTRLVEKPLQDMFHAELVTLVGVTLELEDPEIRNAILQTEYSAAFWTSLSERVLNAMPTRGNGPYVEVELLQLLKQNIEHNEIGAVSAVCPALSTSWLALCTWIEDYADHRHASKWLDETLRQFIG